MAATIEDVAQRAGVSTATVSRALRDQPNVAPATRERVRTAARELEYVADPHAARLAGQRSATIGVVLPLLGWYHSRVFTGAQSLFTDHDLDSLPYVLPNAEVRDRFADELPFRKRVDGLILVDLPLPESAIDRIVDSGPPVVGVGVASGRFPTMSVDNEGAACTATGHLLSLGHRRVALIGGDPERGYTVPRARRDGYRRALREAGVGPDPELECAADFTFAGGAHAMQELLTRRPAPTAVFVMSDEMAIGAMQVARDAGLDIPGDFSVVGFDDHDVAEYVGLTTVRQDVEGHGRRAARLLLDVLDDPRGVDRTRSERLPARLVVRRSTGPPPRAA